MGDLCNYTGKSNRSSKLAGPGKLEKGRVEGEDAVSSLGDRRKGDILNQNKKHSGSQHSGDVGLEPRREF